MVFLYIHHQCFILDWFPSLWNLTSRISFIIRVSAISYSLTEKSLNLRKITEKFNAYCRHWWHKCVFGGTFFEKKTFCLGFLSSPTGWMIAGVWEIFLGVFFHWVVVIWQGVILTIRNFFKTKKFAWPVCTRSMMLKIKMVQKQWLQQKMAFGRTSP